MIEPSGSEAIDIRETVFPAVNVFPFEEDRVTEGGALGQGIPNDAHVENLVLNVIGEITLNVHSSVIPDCEEEKVPSLFEHSIEVSGYQ